MIRLPDTHEIERFRVLIATYLGLHIDDTRLDALAHLLRARCAKHGSAQQYLDSFTDEALRQAELPALARELTITETYFFRNPDQFAAFSELALPQVLAERNGMRGVHILSAGCASGDEPYSLAIAVRDRFPEAADFITITALDVNPLVLNKAAQGRYSNWSLRDTPDSVKQKWFAASDGGGYQLDSAICDAVNFRVGNLAQDSEFWQPGRFDIVFCRNVLMYFSPEQARAAIDRITRALVPDGYLFLGHAETLRCLSNDYYLCHTHNTFYYRRKAEPRHAMAAAPHWVQRPLAQAALIDTSWADIIQRASERISTLTKNFATADAARRGAPPLDLTSALESMHGERYGEALRRIDDLPVEHANDADVLLLKAVSLCHSGALPEAEAVCRELLARDELNAGAQYVLAVCREAAGDAGAAIEHDESACYLDPSFAMPRLHLGLLARRQGDRAAAARELAQAVHLLQQEDASRILLFGGGFKREALVAMCRAHCDAMGVQA